LIGVAALFAVIVPFEKLFPRHRQRLRRPQVGTDVAWALTAAPLGVVGVAVGIVIAGVSLVWIPGLALRPLVSALPGEVRLASGIVLFDFVTYWVHRWSHEVPFFWRFHQIHHSTEQLDWISGFRNHPIDGALLAAPFGLLIAAGFENQFTGILVVVQIVTGLFLHANVRWQWRWLQRLVITPEFHHWHHSDEPAAHNTNYSVFLPVWDIVFGTYRVPKQSRPQRYGVSDPVPAGIVGQLLHPFRGMQRPDRIVTGALCHPIPTFKRLGRAIRQLLSDIARATTRRRVPHEAR
jgi:sterol desaturase/sphingolipid hydroxylase (fatty acid hydroxylase superfamily)